MVSGGNGRGHIALFIDLQAGESLKNFIPLQLLPDNGPGPGIAVQIVQRWLVGDVIPHLPVNSLLPEKGDDSGEVLVEKAGISLSVSGSVPAEQALVFPIFPAHNFRSRLCSPLSKQMGVFKVSNSGPAAEINPTAQLVKAEGVMLTSFIHLHQLNGQPFSTDRGVKRRGKGRREDHVHAVFGCDADKGLHQLPVAGRKDGHLIDRGQTVGWNSSVTLAEDALASGSEGSSSIVTE